MTIENLPLDQLHPDPANARRHPQRNLDQIMSSLARFGQQKPIVIDASNIVRAGNGTLAAAKALAWTHLDVVRTELLGVEATTFAIADNRTAEPAAWDREMLAAAMADPEVGDIGFDSKEVDHVLNRRPDQSSNPCDVESVCQVIADCQDETQQQELFNRLTAEGFSCRLLTL